MHTTSFKDLFMREELKNRISSFGFEHPSEVQQQCLPNSLLGFDILCQAKAGMGKTAVFYHKKIGLQQFSEELFYSKEQMRQLEKKFCKN